MKKEFFLNVLKIFQVTIEVYGKKCILVHTKHKVAVIQPQINLQFHFTVKLLDEIVKPIWLTGNAICKQTWLTGSRNPIWLTSCDIYVKTRL